MRRFLQGFAVVCVAVGFSLPGQAQQDLQFSQYTNNPLFINPATAGVFPGSFRITNNYRVQWQALSEPLTSIGFSADFPIISEIWEGDHVAIGITGFNDETGDSRLTTTSALLTVSYGKSIDRAEQHFVSVGFQGGYADRSVVFDDLYFENQWNGQGFDQSLPTGELGSSLSRGFVDFSTGVHYHFSDRQRFRAHAGLAMFHVNKPDVTFYGGDEQKMFYRYVFHGGIETGGQGDDFILRPDFHYMQQGPNQMFIIGSDIKWLLKYPTKYTGKKKEAWMAIGLRYRWQDAFIPSLQLNFGGTTFGASYDLITSKLGSSINGYGGPEFILSYKGGYKKGHRSHDGGRRFE